MKPLYLCLLLREFPAQAMLRLRSELRLETPVAVIEGVAPLEKVCSMNRPARGIGVRWGMTRTELDSFDELTVLRRSEEEERSAKAAVLEVAGAFTPRVEDHTTDSRAIGLQEAGTACIVVLDVCGTERLFGSVEQLAWRVVKSLRALGLVARAVVSSNLLTAVVVARYEGRVAVTVVAEGSEAAVLAKLPVGVLKPTEEQVERFEAWGLRTVGELAALPEMELVVRMGQGGAWLWRLAQGRAEHLMVPVEAGLVLEEVVEFDTPVDGMESLMFVLGPMLDQLIERAGNRALELASVTVAMGLDRYSGCRDELESGRGEHVRTIKPALPVADRVLLLKLLHLDLEAHPPSRGVVRLKVTAEPGGRSKIQTGLFSPQLPEPGRLEVTLARIAALVGEENVGRARLLDSHAEESFVMEKFVLPEMEGSAKAQGRQQRERKMQELQRRRELLQRSTTSSQGESVETSTPVFTADIDPECSLQRQRTIQRSFAALKISTGGREDEGPKEAEQQRPVAVALRRMRPPVLLKVRLVNGNVSVFYLHGVRYEVQQRYGPWRRSGDWWKGEVWSCEEWDVSAESSNGVRLLCVLTHDLLRGQWHMAGMYD